MWQVGIFVCFGWVVSLCFHEFGHAIVAYWGGDTSVKDKGYLSLNPLKYTEPGLSLFLPILFLIMGGIGLPGGAVYINHSRLRNRYWKSAVSAAGPLANIIITLVLLIPLWLKGNHPLDNPWFLPSLAFLIFLQLFAIVLNLLPIPSLDGYGIIQPWLPTSLNAQLMKVSQYGIWIVIGLFWFSPSFSRGFWFFIIKIAEGLGVPLDLIFQGANLFDALINKVILFLGLMLLFWGLQKNEMTWFNRGARYQQTQNYPLAIEAYRKALSINPDYYEALCNLAYCLHRLKNYEEVPEIYDKMLALRPEDSQIYYAKASVLTQARKYNSAIKTYQKLLDIHPQEFQAWYERGCLLEMYEQDDKALGSYQKAIEIKPDFYQSWYREGELCRKIGYIEQALYAYNKVLEMRPEDANTWLVRGRTLEENHQYQEAIDSYTQGTELEPNYYGFWYFRGQCYYHLKQYDEAIKDYEKATELKQGSSDAWYNLACCYALNNQPDPAITALEKALNLDPERLKEYAKVDPDLNNLQFHPQFIHLISA